MPRREWDEMQAEADVMGYIGSHVLRDRDNPGHYVIVAEFARRRPQRLGRRRGA